MQKAIIIKSKGSLGSPIKTTFSHSNRQSSTNIINNWIYSPIYFFFSIPNQHTHLSSLVIRGGVLIHLGWELPLATNTTHYSHFSCLERVLQSIPAVFLSSARKSLWLTSLWYDLSAHVHRGKAWHRNAGGVCRLVEVRVTHLSKGKTKNEKKTLSDYLTSTSKWKVKHFFPNSQSMNQLIWF